MHLPVRCLSRLQNSIPWSYYFGRVRHVPRPGGLVLKKFLHNLQLQILLAALHLHSHCLSLLYQPSVPNQHQTVVATPLTTHSLLQWYKDSFLTVSEYLLDGCLVPCQCLYQHPCHIACSLAGFIWVRLHITCLQSQ